MPSTLMVNMDGNEILEFDAKVVSVNPQERNENKDVAVNFDFPSPKFQSAIRQKIQSEELKKALKVYLNAGD